MSKPFVKSEFFYVAKDDGNWSVTGSSIHLDREVKGPDLEAIRKELARETEPKTLIRLLKDPGFPQSSGR